MLQRTKEMLIVVSTKYIHIIITYFINPTILLKIVHIHSFKGYHNVSMFIRNHNIIFQPLSLSLRKYTEIDKHKIDPAFCLIFPLKLLQCCNLR